MLSFTVKLFNTTYQINCVFGSMPIRIPSKDGHCMKPPLPILRVALFVILLKFHMIPVFISLSEKKVPDRADKG